MKKKFTLFVKKNYRLLIAFIALGLMNANLFAQTSVYSTGGPATFTVPAGVTSVTVECWGAGGAGAGFTNATPNGAGGGGGGAYAKTIGVLVAPSNTYAINIGTGGTGTTGTGSAGGLSSATFGAITVSAAGGNAGISAVSGAGGAGGTVAGSSGTILYAGGAGATGSSTNYGGGGGSSAGSISAGNNGSTSTSNGGPAVTGGGAGGNGGATNGASGNPGSSPGGGGGGVKRNGTGGNGADGQITITYGPVITNFNSPVCVGGTVTITGSYFASATAIQFNGVAGTIVTNTGTVITATFPATATSGNIVITNAGGTGTGTTALTILPVPTPPVFSPAPSTPVCSGSSQTYSVNAIGTNTFTWSATGTSWTSTASTTTSFNATAGTATGTISVTDNNGACSSSPTTATIAVNPTTITLSNPIPPAGNIIAGTNNAVVFGFTLTPNACASNYNFTAVSILGGGSATTLDLSNFQLVYDVNADGLYEPATDIIVSATPQALSGLISFAITGQTGITTARNYLLIANVSSTAALGDNFSATLNSSGAASPTVGGITVTGGATGFTQTIKGSATITAVQPAAGFLLQSTTNNPIAAYQIVDNAGTFTPASFKFTTAGTYVSGDITNFQLWQSTNSTFSTATATSVQIIGWTGNPQTLTFNSGFTALSAGTTYYFYITSDIPTTAVNGDNVNIATDALTNFAFGANVVTSGTTPTTVGNTQTIEGASVSIATQATPAAGNIPQNTTSNPIAAYQITVSNFSVTPTSFVFTTGGTYSNLTDITKMELYVNTTNSITGATMIGTAVAAPATGGTVTFNTGFSSLPVGTVYFIVTADAYSCATNGKTIWIKAGTANFANFNFTNTANSTYNVGKTGTSNPVTLGNTQTIVSPTLAISTQSIAAGIVAQGTTNNIIASYLMTASNGSVTPTGFTFTTGGTYTTASDFTNFQLWVNTSNNLTTATLVGAFTPASPASGGTIAYTGSFPAAATIPAGSGYYFLITADVPLSGISGDFVNIAANVLTNLNFTNATGGCVATSGSLTASNNQSITGPAVAISTSHPAAGNIVQGSTNNILAVYQLNVSNAVSVTPTNVTLTTTGTYVAADLVNFKIYENTNATLSGATFVQSVTGIPVSGGTITFNSGFTAIGSFVTTYLIITTDVASTATLGDNVRFTSTPFTNFSFISSTGSGVAETGTNPAATSKVQTIVGPQVAIGTQHNPAGNILRGSQNNLLAIYTVTATNAPITPSSVTFVTNGTYAGSTDIQDFNLYQNTSPTLTGATLLQTVLATGATSGQTIVFNSGFSTITNISPNNTSYLILVADVAGSAIPGDYIAINSISPPLSSSFSFTSSGPVAITTATALAASNNQTIVNKLNVYWSGTGNWDNVTNNWAQVSGGPYNTSVWLQNGYGFFEGTSGNISIVSPSANILADSLTSNVNNYQIDASASGNGITMVSPASFTVNTGTTYIGINNTTFPVLSGNNGLVKRGSGELQIAAPFQSTFAGTVYVDAGEFTFGAKNGTSDPYLFFPGNNSFYINNAKLTLAGSSSIQTGGFGRYSYASPRNLSILKAYGIDTIDLYQTTATATAWMRVWPSTDGNLPTAATSTPFEISGTLTLIPQGIVTGTVGVNWNQQNALVTGSTTLTGNTTLVGYASNGASISSGAGTQVNFNIGGAGHYLYGVKGAYSNGTLTDNGYSLTFLGGGNSTTDGSELCLNSTSSVMTGNWVIGDAAGVNAGWLVANTTTSLTTGTAVINNYSKMMLQITTGKSKNVTYAPSSISIYGLGPANQTYYPSALDLYNITSDSINTISFASNIILNPAGATALASIGVEVAGTVTNVVSYQLNGTVTGTAGLEKTGPGNLILNAQNPSGYINTYQGNTQINAGKLTVNYGSNLGTAGLLLSQTSDVFTGTDSNTLAGFNTALILNNASQTVSSVATAWTNTDGETQTITLNGCTFTDNQSTNTTFGNSTTGSSLGYITGTGNFIKSGTGTLTLTGPNTYTGLTQVAGGTLALSHAGGTTLPMTNTVDIIGGTLSVTTAQTLKNMTLSTGTLNVASGITLTITGSFTLVNGKITGGGTLAYSSGTLIYAGSSAQTVNSGNNPVEWPTVSVPTNITFDNFTYTGLGTGAGGVQLITGKTVPSGGTATVNGWLDFAGNAITGAGGFTLNGSTSQSYTGNTASGSSYITSVSAINNIYAGMLVTGTGIPSGTYITYIDTVLKTYTIFLNNNATATGSAVTLTFSTRGGVKISMPSGLGNGTATSHVQVTGTKTYNSGADYVFNAPTTGTQIYPGFPTTSATATYSPAWDVKINAGSGNNVTMAASGTGSSVEIADSLILNAGVWATNTGLVKWDNPGSTYLIAPNIPWTAGSVTFANSYIATCDNTGTPINVAGNTIPLSGSYGFQINNVGPSSGNVYFPVGASFNPDGTGFTPTPDRMMLNMNAGGVATNFNVVVNYGDIDNTPNARVSRIWYVNATDTTAVDRKVNMKLFFVERTTSNWPVGENEVENAPLPFDYTNIAMIERDYSATDPNFIAVSSGTDIMSFPNGTYNNQEVYGQYTVGVSPNVAGQKIGIYQFNRFSLFNSGGIVLPVKVIDFKAYQKGSGVQTSWTSLNELNMEGYEVERSADAENFTQIGTVAALNNGEPSINYSFFDAHPLEGNNYYRIKILGKDGSISYTNIEVVVIGAGASSINIYPNPVVDHTFVLQMNNIVAGNYTLEIYNTLGQLILNQVISHAGGSASQTIQLPAGTAKGEYQVKLLGTTSQINKMIIVQ